MISRPHFDGAALMAVVPVAAIAMLASTAALAPQGVARGTLLLTGGGFGPGVAERFGTLVGADASVLYIPSASSGIRLPSGFVWSPPEETDATHNEQQFTIELAPCGSAAATPVVLRTSFSTHAPKQNWLACSPAAA